MGHRAVPAHLRLGREDVHELPLRSHDVVDHLDFVHGRSIRPLRAFLLFFRAYKDFSISNTAIEFHLLKEVSLISGAKDTVGSPFDVWLEHGVSETR